MLWVMIKKEMCLCGPLTGFRLSAGNLKRNEKQRCLFFQHFPDLAGYKWDIERLLDEPVASLVHNMLCLTVKAIPAAQDYPRRRVQLPDAVKSFTCPKTRA